MGAGPRAITELLVAVGEACTNVVEHADGSEGGLVTVHLELQLLDVVATIGNTGWWRLPRGGSRGRGRRIMRHCGDDVCTDHGPVGTTVVIGRRLAGEATR